MRRRYLPKARNPRTAASLVSGSKLQAIDGLRARFRGWGLATAK